MRVEIHGLVSQGMSGDEVIAQYVARVGDHIRIVPTAAGFNLLAWFLPGIAFGLGLALVVIVLHHWHRRVVLTPASAPMVSPAMLDRMRRQADEETED